MLVCQPASAAECEMLEVLANMGISWIQGWEIWKVVPPVTFQGQHHLPFQPRPKKAWMIRCQFSCIISQKLGFSSYSLFNRMLYIYPKFTRSYLWKRRQFQVNKANSLFDSVPSNCFSLPASSFDFVSLQCFLLLYLLFFLFVCFHLSAHEERGTSVTFFYSTRKCCRPISALKTNTFKLFPPLLFCDMFHEATSKSFILFPSKCICVF